MGAATSPFLVIVVDTSVWIDHSRSAEPALTVGLRDGGILVHEFVIGELALGNMPDRDRTMRFLGNIPRVPTLPADVVLEAIARMGLSGTGVGYVDAHLLCAALAIGCRVWTRDKRLRVVAERLNVRAEIE